MSKHVAHFDITIPVGPADAGIASAYPFMFDVQCSIAISADDTYSISRGGVTEIVIMPWSIIDDYARRKWPTEVIPWCAMYDCLVERSSILKSYYPLDKRE